MAERVLTVFVCGAALAAAFISHTLTVKHISGTSGLAWFEAACSDQAAAGQMNCARVLESPYSYIPPKRPDQPDKIPRLPASFLGLAYYSTLFVWVTGVGRPSWQRRRLHLLPLLLVGAGLAFSGYFLWIMYGVIHEWCPWCLVTHGLNVLIAIGLVLLWPRRPRALENIEDDAGALFFPTPHPTARHVLITILAVLFINYGHFYSFTTRGCKKESGMLLAELTTMRSNVGGFLAQWKGGTPCELGRRADDPVRQFSQAGESEPFLDVVVFSDFECPLCARFAQFFEKNVPPLFDSHVRLTYRYYPLDQSCNPRTPKTLHPHACAAAFLAERARLLGGNETFWKAHDFLFAHRSDVAAGTMTAGRVAEASGLDPASLAATGDPAAISGRMVEDIDQGRRCGIRGTPSIFVEGKQVETAAATNLEFWDKLADWYWQQKARKVRPSSTRPPPAAPKTTQG